MSTNEPGYHTSTIIANGTAVIQLMKNIAMPVENVPTFALSSLRMVKPPWSAIWIHTGRPTAAVMRPSGLTNLTNTVLVSLR